MNKRNRLMALVGAGVLLLGLAGTALADGGLQWDGKGVTDGQLDTVDCTQQGTNVAYLQFNFTLGGGDNSITGATLTVDGDVYTTFVQDGNVIKFITSFYDLSTLSASVAYTGDLGSGVANLTISHGCAGESSSSSSSSSTTSFTSTESSASTSESSTSSSVSFTSSESGATATLANTATVGDSGTSGPSGNAWLLLAALGMVAGSIVVLMPARAKNRR